ncbi:ADAM 17-like protease [Pomacea canaliculata]|uniref:ADAM 17-like protease n=1 Tax=Pomacea canaliculata TaxID=400727 RepID=UPI000D7324C0|nr:ADAM 17-like protease [Pomacea canaliculata]
MVCFLALFILLQCILQHTVTALENRDPNIEENNLHKQLFHYETLKKSDISLHVRHHRDVDTGHVTARTYVTFFTLGMNFSMVLKAGSPVLAPGLRAHTVDRNGKYEPLHVDSNDFLTGHLQEDKSIHVYAHYEEDILCTTVYFPNETYFTEPSWRHLPSSSGLDLISYRLSDVNWNNMGDFPNPVILPHFSNGSTSSDKQHQKFRQKRQSQFTKKLCSLRLVADYYFYSQYARFSASRALQAMVNSIQEANRIYQDTPWDLAEPFGWGFVIKQILVHTELSDGYWGGPFSYNLKEMESNPFLKLDAFSIHEDLLKFCLAHLFTTTSFEKGIVGLGYMANDRHPGGICSSYYYQIIPRTGLTTTMTTTGLHLVRTHHQLVTVHELGHNWGSDHDTPGPCAPSDDDGGRYIHVRTIRARIPAQPLSVFELQHKIYF